MMMIFLRRLRRSAGEYFFSGGGVEYTDAPPSCAEEDEFSSAMLFSLEVFLHALLAITQGTNKGNLREVVAVQTRNVLLVCAGDRLLRLHDLYRVCDSRTEPIPGLGQCLIGQVDVAACNIHLLRRRLQVEQCCAHIGLDLCAQVVEALAGPFKPRISFLN